MLCIVAMVDCILLLLLTAPRVFLGKILSGGKPMFQEIEGGGHRLELKYIMCFVASASLAYSSCLILHSVCAN